MNVDIDKLKSRLVWWVSLTVIGGAAAGMTGWSLYVVAHDRYGVPGPLAAGTAAVFDGTAIACLYLAGQAIRERRSALGPHCATLGLAAVSVYLNRLHADLIGGGRGAFVLFATPTAALLVLAGLSWSAQRARLRAEDGDRPAALPKLGFWAWLLATDEAWERTKGEVAAHVSGTDKVRTPSGQAPGKPRTAADALRAHFAALDPIEAIRLAHSARPDAPPAELANELSRYEVDVSAIEVALVLNELPPATTIQRPPAPVRTQPDTLPAQPPAVPLTGTDLLSGHTDTVASAARQLIRLGVTDRSLAIPLIMNALSVEDARLDNVRRAFDRAIGQQNAKSSTGGEQLPLDEIGTGGGGYA
ncbi:hypothetical protein CTZ27_33195 [Streptomyces griseocarneus]|nr:hypothetical protein CTZ27_33195 [Streptomyces griseocarneus]